MVRSPRKRSSSFQQQQDRMDSLFESRGDACVGKKGRRRSRSEPSENRATRQASKNKAEKNKAKKKKEPERKIKRMTRPQPQSKKRLRNDSGESPSRKRIKRTQWHFPFPDVIPPTILWKRKDTSDPYTLDDELEDFSKYVRLETAERAVRDAWTAKLHRISPVEVFGSHSVPEICAFCSDIDVCIVEAEKEDPAPVPKPVIVPINPQKEDAEVLRFAKREKLKRKNRWLDALGAADEEKDASTQSGKDGDNEIADMFQIDRKGSTVSASSSDVKIEESETDSDADSADPLVSAIHLGGRTSIVATNSEQQPNVAFTAERVTRTERPMTKAQVLRLLRVFRNKLHKNYRNLIVKSQIINARVPIIKVSTVSGCDTDIACGGYKGNDTSLYAAEKVRESQSFAPVVLFLKILLNQHGLDVPFTGGLGSYKLYVLVSDHCRKNHQKPTGMVLVGFLDRFSSPHGREVKALGDGSAGFVGSDGASADLSNVFRWDECCALFALTFSRLQRSNYRLASVIDTNQLRGDRDLVRGQHCGSHST